MLKLTSEEEVFALQLFDIRKQLERLHIEEQTHTDRLLTVLRGHGTQSAHGHPSEGVTITRAVVDGQERIIVTKFGLPPNL